MATSWSSQAQQCNNALVDKQLSLLSFKKGPLHTQKRFPSRHHLPVPTSYGCSVRRPVQAMASSLTSPSSSPASASKEAQALSSITIFSADGTPVQFQQLWDQSNGTAVVAFLRHFGCPLCWEFAALLRDTKPKFDAAGVKLIVLGVGTPDKARILAEKLPFPKEVLYADPDRKAYDALGLYYGLGRTFFNPASAKVLSRLDTIQKALKGYTLEATPDDRASVLQQGGLFVFKGTQLLYARKDEGTGDHAALDDVLNICCSTAVC